MSKFTIYHNPRCSKSRQTLQLLEENGIEPEVVLYLDTPPTAVELKAIVEKLGISPRDLLRKGEQAYKDNNLSDTSLSDSDLLEAMVAHPKLIERPIVIKSGVIKSGQAVLGRPPENVLTLI